MRRNSSLQPWCEYSSTCYMVGMERHVCHPEYSSPYMVGCPEDQSRCDSAKMVERVQKRLEDSQIRCAWCGGLFSPRNVNQVYCSQICADDAKNNGGKCRQ